MQLNTHTHTQPDITRKRARDLVEATPTWSDFEVIWGSSSVHDHYYQKSDHTTGVTPSYTGVHLCPPFWMPNQRVHKGKLFPLFNCCGIT